MKKYLKRHFFKIYKNKKINALKFQARSVTQKQKASHDSVVWFRCQQMKPFSDVEMKIKCMDEEMESVFEGKQKEEMTSKFKHPPR